MKVHYLILLLKCIVLCIYLIISFSVVETQDMLLGSTILLSDDFSESEVDSWCTITDSTNMVVGQLHLLVTLVGDEAGSCSDCSDSPPIVAAPDPPVLPSIPEFTQAAVSSEFTSIEDFDEASYEASSSSSFAIEYACSTCSSCIY